MRQHIGEHYYGTQHTTSGYPLSRKSVSCPRAYRGFLVTEHAFVRKQSFMFSISTRKKLFDPDFDL